MHIKVTIKCFHNPFYSTSVMGYIPCALMNCAQEDHVCALKKSLKKVKLF